MQESNKAIIKLAKTVGGNAWDFLSNGMMSSKSAYGAMEEGTKSIAKAVGQGHMKKGAELALKNVDAKKVAGSYILASGAYRVASGGGVYKDQHGNADVMGVPFI